MLVFVPAVILITTSNTSFAPQLIGPERLLFWPAIIAAGLGLALVKELTEAIWDLWGEHGKARERTGEFIQRVGLSNFLEEIGLDPVPEMVMAPRSNPYIFFDDEIFE